MIQSHLKVAANFRSILLMHLLFFLEAVAAFIISVLFTLIGLLIPLIPIVIVFMAYWTSGYDFGLLAKKMVEQEGLTLSRS